MIQLLPTVSGFDHEFPLRYAKTGGEVINAYQTLFQRNKIYNANFTPMRIRL